MPVMRFEDLDGAVHWGQEESGDRAQILEGDLAHGFVATGKYAQVARLMPPLQPVNIFGIGLNYRRHAEETGQTPSEHPTVFMKPTSSVIGPEEPILLPNACLHGPEVDYECELAVIIGPAARDVSEQEALDHVFGFTCANDVSARRWQKRAGGGQWVRGKSFDTFCPLGPRILGVDEIGDPQNLKISTLVNGELRQSSNTRDMIFTVQQLVSFLSRDTTLMPGTVILTGTPEGVGFVREPPLFLEEGDVVTVEIEKIGQLTNPVEVTR